MKRVQVRIFNYKNCKNKYDYSVAILNPTAWHFIVTNGAISYYNSFLNKNGYKTKAAAIAAAKAFRTHAKKLGLI